MSGIGVRGDAPALAAWRRLGDTNGRLQSSMERLASGLRIRRSADDAAGLAASDRLRSQVYGLQRAKMNVLDGISLLQVVDGAYNTVTDMLQRMRSLTVQAASDTITDDDRRLHILPELEELYEEIDRISEMTEFNGRKVFGDRLPTMSTRMETYFPVSPFAGAKTFLEGTRQTFARGVQDTFRPGTTQIGSAGAPTGATEVFGLGTTDSFPFAARGTVDPFNDHGDTEVFNSIGVTEAPVTPGTTEALSTGATESFTRGLVEFFSIDDPAVDNVLTLNEAPEDYNPGLNGSEIVTLNDTLQLSQGLGEYSLVGNVITIDPTLLSPLDSVTVRYIGAGGNTFTLADPVEAYGAVGSEIVRLEGVALTRDVDYTVAGADITLIDGKRLVGNNNDAGYHVEVEYVPAGGNTFTLGGVIDDYAAPPAGSEVVTLTGMTLGGAVNGAVLTKGVDYQITGAGDEITLIGDSRLTTNDGAAVGAQGQSLSVDYVTAAENTIALSDVADPDGVEVRVDGALQTQGVDYLLQAGDTEVQFVGPGRLVGRQDVAISYLRPGDEVISLAGVPLDLNLDPTLADSEEVRVNGALMTAGVDYIFTAPDEISFLPGRITGDPNVTISYLTAAESNAFTLSGVPIDYAPDAGSERVLVDGVEMTRGAAADYTLAGNVVTFNPGRLRGEHDVTIGFVTDPAVNDFTLSSSPADYLPADPARAGSEIVTKILPDASTVLLAAGVDYRFTAPDQIQLMDAGRLRGGEDVQIGYVRAPELTLALPDVPDDLTTVVTVNGPGGPVVLGAGQWSFVPGPFPSATIQIADGVVAGDPTDVTVEYQTSGGRIEFQNAPLDYDPAPNLAGSERFYIDGVEQTPGVDYGFVDADTIQVADITKLAGNPEIRLEYPFLAGANTLTLSQTPAQYAAPPNGSETVDVTSGAVGSPPVSGLLTKDTHYTVAGNLITLLAAGRVYGDPTLAVGYVADGDNTMMLAGTPLDYQPAMAGSEVVTIDGAAPLDRSAGDYALAGNQVTLQGPHRLVSGPHTVVVQYAASNDFRISPVIAVGGQEFPGWIIDGTVSVTVDGAPVAMDAANGWSLVETPGGSTTDYVNPDTGRNFRVDQQLYDYDFRLNGASRLVGDNGGAGHEVEFSFTFNPHEEYQLNVPPGTVVSNEEVRNIFLGEIGESPTDGYEIVQTTWVEEQQTLGSRQRNYFIVNEETAPYVRSATQLTYDYVTGTVFDPHSFIIQAGANEGQIIPLDIETWSADSIGLGAVNVTNRETSSDSLDVLDEAIDRISEMRTRSGSKQNRLEKALYFVGESRDHQATAESRIRDLDVSDEVVLFSRDKILQQAGTSALAQANLISKTALALLR